MLPTVANATNFHQKLFQNATTFFNVSFTLYLSSSQVYEDIITFFNKSAKKNNAPQMQNVFFLAYSVPLIEKLSEPSSFRLPARKPSGMLPFGFLPCYHFSTEHDRTFMQLVLKICYASSDNYPPYTSLAVSERSDSFSWPPDTRSDYRYNTAGT